MPTPPSLSRVEEFQGLYGPFQVSELLIQRIWLKQAFDVSRMRDSLGRRIEVEYPGDWNRLDGPDFKNAVLSIDGERVLGDVEVHFSVGDWVAHGHEHDARYDKVKLHVLYHLPTEGAMAARTHSGRTVPSVSLMPWLWYDIEEYAEQDSIVSSTGMDNAKWLDVMLGVSLVERVKMLGEGARRRWDQKVSFAETRIKRLGWAEACHQSALEIMGYRFNRIPMLQLAGLYPLGRFEGEVLDLETLWGELEGVWRLTGCRPANHPRLRLEQYSAWCMARPRWPERLEALVAGLAEFDGNATEAVSEIRKSLAIKELRGLFVSSIVAHEVSGAKLDTLVCDGFLPLAAARSGVDVFAYWFCWYVGNVPESCRTHLKQLQVLEAAQSPASNGWMQGVLSEMFK